MCFKFNKFLNHSLEVIWTNESNFQVTCGTCLKSSSVQSTSKKSTFVELAKCFSIVRNTNIFLQKLLILVTWLIQHILLLDEGQIYLPVTSPLGNIHYIYIYQLSGKADYLLKAKIYILPYNFFIRAKKMWMSQRNMTWNNFGLSPYSKSI